MKTNRSLSVFLALAIVMLLALTTFAGCVAPSQPAPEATKPAQAAAPEKKIVVGRIMFDLSHPYQQADAKNFETYLQSQGVETVIIDGKSAPDVMANAMQDLVAKKVSGIVVQPADGAAITPAVKEAQKAGIPVSTFFVRTSDGKAPHVNINEKRTAYDMGVYVAQKAKEFFPGKDLKLGVINQPGVQYVQENRVTPFVEGVKSVDPKVEVFDVDGGGVREKALAAGEDLLQAHKDVNIVYGINADSALGALAAFEAAGRGKAVDGKPVSEIFVSIDGSEQEAVRILNPNSALKVAMALSPLTNARVNADTIMKAIKGEYGMEQDVVVDTFDTVIDYWRMDLPKVQDFLTTEYLSKIDLKAELAKTK